MPVTVVHGRVHVVSYQTLTAIRHHRNVNVTLATSYMMEYVPFSAVSSLSITAMKVSLLKVTKYTRTYVLTDTNLFKHLF